MSLDGSRGQYYRSRAVEVRAVAETCKDLAIKAQLETVAQGIRGAGPMGRKRVSQPLGALAGWLNR
jgi:hypothetical protein